MTSQNNEAIKFREKARSFAKMHYAECAAELIEWQDTAILCDGKVRQLGLLCSHFIGGYDDLRVAESMITREVLLATCAAPAIPQAQSLLSDEEIVAIYKSTFESMPGCACQAPTTLPVLVLEFAKVIISKIRQPITISLTRNHDGQPLLSLSTGQRIAFKDIIGMQEAVKAADGDKRDGEHTDAFRYKWLMNNPHWGIRWRLKNGNEQWQMVDEGDSWGQWGPHRQVIDAIIQVQNDALKTKSIDEALKAHMGEEGKS